ncbi:MAG: DMP19 family protein [Prevotellaceae bacterium]|nr:DMP19 family protein [Candidatus Faecinaster equi]
MPIQEVENEFNYDKEQYKKDSDALKEKVIALVGEDCCINAENFSKLKSDEITLVAYYMLKEELLEGGFVQLIQNGYGPFFFDNPFAKAMRLWGLKDFSKWLYKVKDVYEKCKSELSKQVESDDEFMALYEQYPQFEVFDDEFIVIEPYITHDIVAHI